MLLTEDITAIILSGGQGSRMDGKDKGLVCFQNKPLIKHVIDCISPQVKDIVISCNRNHDSYADYGYPITSDMNSSDCASNSQESFYQGPLYQGPIYQGPLAGIQAGLNIVKTKAAIIVPCDSPNIPKDLVKRLRLQLDENKISVAIPSDGTRIQPLFSLITMAVKEPLNDYLLSGQRKAELFFRQQKPEIVDFSDLAKHFLNFNTIQSLQDSDSH